MNSKHLRILIYAIGRLLMHLMNTGILPNCCRHQNSETKQEGEWSNESNSDKEAEAEAD